MNPIAVVVGAEQLDLPLRLRDELRAREMPCVVLVERGGSASEAPAPAPASACAALAAAGISTVVVADPARVPSLAADLQRTLPRVLAAQPPTDATAADTVAATAADAASATAADLQARGWIPARGEVYTQDELDTVTARLKELGYA